MPTLPRYICPMLARPGQPFDSSDYLFEVKWDGMRALAFVDRDGQRIVSRRGHDVTGQFPELASLARLPPGTVLDGELVVLRESLPDLSLLATRHQVRAPQKIRLLSRTTPAVLIAFDLLYCDYRSLMPQTLLRRRERLAATLQSANARQVVFSEGIVGAGRDFYEQVIAQQLEGVMAKRLSSRYLPGRRSDAWLKIKPRQAARAHNSLGKH